MLVKNIYATSGITLIGFVVALTCTIVFLFSSKASYTIQLFRLYIKTLILLFLLLPSAIVSAQFLQANSNTILVGGEPSLTQEMIIRLATIYETILKIKFTTQQQERLQKGIVKYWVTKSKEAIKQCLDNLKYYGQQDELESLRNSSQSAIVESLGRDLLKHMMKFR